MSKRGLGLDFKTIMTLILLALIAAGLYVALNRILGGTLG